MKLSSLARVLSAGMPTADFVREIEPEVAEYQRALAKRGGVAQVRVEQDHPLVFDHAGLATLCSRFAAGDLTTEQLAYVADAILLASHPAPEPLRLIRVYPLFSVSIRGQLFIPPEAADRARRAGHPPAR